MIKFATSLILFGKYFLAKEIAEWLPSHIYGFDASFPIDLIISMRPSIPDVIRPNWIIKASAQVLRTPKWIKKIGRKTIG